jgi:hypothetical protein
VEWPDEGRERRNSVQKVSASEGAYRHPEYLAAAIVVDADGDGYGNRDDACGLADFDVGGLRLEAPQVDLSATSLRYRSVLGWEANRSLAPMPFVEELLRKRIAIGVAFRIEARAWIAG